MPQYQSAYPVSSGTAREPFLFLFPCYFITLAFEFSKEAHLEDRTVSGRTTRYVNESTNHKILVWPSRKTSLSHLAHLIPFAHHMEQSRRKERFMVTTRKSWKVTFPER